MITETLPPELLGLVVVARFPVSVAVGLGILLIDPLERSESKISRVLFVEVDFMSSLPLDGGEKAEMDLPGALVVISCVELRALVSLADGELGMVCRKMHSAIKDEFDVTLDDAVTPAPKTVVFANLVVEIIA